MNREVVGSIPGLAPWVKDLAWPCAVVWVTDAARIPCRCGSGAGRWPQLPLDPEPETSVCRGCGPRKKKGERKRKFLSVAASEDASEAALPCVSCARL